MADDDHDRLIGDDVLCVGHADIRLGLIVVGDELDSETSLFQLPLELLHGELGPELGTFAKRGLTAAQRTLGGDLDRLALRGRPRPQRQEGNGQRRAERDKASDTVQIHGLPP
jgi:hypothetical protein